ncbi:MAG: protein kinase [Catenulispora sp.]|nr:protein kinase [Catenulispora sp.]
MADEVIDNRYRLLELLGRGGMGEVWRAQDTRIGREVAVKIVTAGGLTDEALARFDREARIAGNMSGPSIVTVHDYGHDQYSGRPVPYLVMELVAGRTIADRVRRDGPPDPRTALHWTLQICEALTTAHAANVVHRDIKPSNVMVTDTGTVKVLDFGIARFMEHQHTRTDLTAAGMVIGSAEYMSPEQAQGHRIDARSDLYSLGCLLFFTLTGRGPFEADSPVGLAYQHVNKQAEPPSRYRIGIPAGVDALVLELLAKDPEVRPADARAVGERIRRLSAEVDRAESAAAGQAGGQGGAAYSAEAASNARQTAPSSHTGSTAPSSHTGSAPTDQPTGQVTRPLGQTGATASGQPVGPVGHTGPTTAGQPVGQAAAAFPAPPGRDTEFWMPGQDTQVTEVRQYPGNHYPGNHQPPAPPFAATVSAQSSQPPQPERPSRRWFIAGATAVAVSGAGVGAWLALGDKSSPDKSSGSSDFTGSGGSSPSGSHSAKANSSSAAPSTSATSTSTSTSTSASASSSSSASAGPALHNPTYASRLTQHHGPVAHVAFLPTGRTLVSASHDTTARLWDVTDPANPRALGVCEKHTDVVWNVALSADGGTLATLSFDQSLILWDIRNTRSPRFLTQVTVSARPNGVAFNAAGLVAVGIGDGTILLLDSTRADDASARWTFTGHSQLVYSVAFSPDGKTLASSSFDRSVRLWDVSTPSAAKQLGSLTHSDRVFDIAFHPQGKIVAAGSADRQLILIDVSRPDHPTVLQPISEGDEATGVAFSPDGRLVANGCGASKQVRVYDVTNPATPHGFDPLTGHTDYTIGVAFSADGKVLASSSQDGTVRLWRF